MAQSGRKTEKLGINLEQALELYLSSIARDNELLWDLLARMILVLVELLRRIPSTELSSSIQEATAHCVKCVCCQGEGRLAIFIGESGAIPSLLSLLLHTDGSFQRFRHGGLEIILNLLNTCSDDLKRYLLEILSALALWREVRRTILIAWGFRFLVESARCGSMLSRCRAAQASGLLGLVKRARRTLVDSGTISVLLELLQVGDPSSKAIAANALGAEPMGKEIAEDVFCILAAVEENAVAIVEHLVRILRGDSSEAKAATADVLWDLADYKHLPSVVRNSGAIHILVQLLEDQNVYVRERVSGAISQLSYNEADRAALADSGAIPRLVDKLQDELEEMTDNAAEALVNFSEDPSLGDRIPDVLNKAYLAASLRRMSIEQLTMEPAALI
ncbi:unnamed protein product [Withania somnifera]